MDDTSPIVKEVYIDAPPEEVFPYLTSSEKYLLWMGVAAQLDPRPGGHFEVDPNGRDVIFGEFVEVTPPSRIVFTWGWNEPGHPMPAGSTRVEIELVPQDGGTLLRLRHHGVPNSMREKHDGGWSHYLGRLERLMRGEDPGPDPYAHPGHRHS